MTPQQYQRASRLFDDALQRDAAQRESFIAAADDDTAVLRAVRGMLAQHDAPAFDLDSAALGAELDLPSLAASAPSPMPSRIGPYEIIDILGIGGMSVVYRARQVFPDRLVALKVLRPAALSPAALRRFRAEIQMLAKLSHPNIAQVFDAGSFADGETSGIEQPYFAMELVEGLPLTEFAQRHQLTVPQRLRVMIDICRAVQHAHLRGVIHRDLKPGNVLVEAGDQETERRRDDANPTDRSLGRTTPSLRLSVSPSLAYPKVLDFGIARATDLDVTRATIAAETGRIVGTLPYMSPEQLSGDAASIDLRCDVYALGVVLFELLTYQLPHRLSGEMSLTQTAQTIASHEPRRVSEIDRSLRGEIEAIVSTALERDRDRRYQSAEALADDLQAHLEHRPIRARSPGMILRTRKWIRRHPALAASASLILLAGVAIGGIIAQQRAATRLAAAREQQRVQAEADARVIEFADNLDATMLAHQQLADVRNHLYRYNPPAEAQRLEREERRLLALLSDHEAAFHRAQNLISQAQRLGGSPDDIAALHARLYLARSREAEAAGDRFNRAVYLDLMRQNDPERRLANALAETLPLMITTDPPGAEAHLFKLVEQSEIDAGGEPRLVPVPVRSAADDAPQQSSSLRPQASKPQAAPGQFALRIVDGKDILNPDDLILAVGGDSQRDGQPIRDAIFIITAPAESSLQPFDRLVAIDGAPVRSMYDVRGPPPGPNASRATAARTFEFAHASDPALQLHGASLDALHIRVGDPAAALHELGGRATVWRRGEILHIDIPPGLEFRITAKPLLVGPDSLVGHTPLRSIPVERGMYILLLLKDGFEPLRVPIPVHGEDGMLRTMALATWRLLPRGSSPAGLVRSAQWILPQGEPHWIMEREVTLGEYLEFLNDPLTRARIDAAPGPILYPRSGALMECGRDRDTGLFNAGPELRDDFPVLAINWQDAKDYAQWRTAQAHARGEIADEYIFDLPTHQEWLSAWGCGPEDQHPWGLQFRPHWCSSNYAHALPGPEAVMSFPIDESNIGVFDLAGSVSEWLNAWWIEDRDQREVAGGSWGHGGYNYKDMFMLYGQNGVTSTVTNGTCGFRLVMRKKA